MNRAATAWIGAFIAAGALAVLVPVQGAEDNLPAAVNAAIRKGREWLYRAYGRPGFPDHGYPMGAEALYLYALLKSGHNPDDPFIHERFRRLASFPPEKTYSVALYMMALDARYRRRAEERGIREAGPISGADRRTMESLLRWLLSARWQGEGVWSYGAAAGGHHDHSNTQFAILGLEIALRNRLVVPASVLEEIGSSFVMSQVIDGNSIEFDITFRAPWFERRGATSVSARTKPAAPGGWGYHGNAGRRSQPARDRPTMSMSAAGLSNLLVVRSGLRAYGRPIPVRLEEAIRQGMVWIGKNAEEARQMRAGGGGIFRNYFYTIYSIEKAGDLGEVIRFGAYDWYREEAAYLVRTQDADGHWGESGAAAFVHTSFALLFLTRATAEFQLVDPPTIFTHADLKAEDRDKVFVDELKGFVSARDFFGFLASGREAKAIPIAREVVRNYPPDARPELIPLLVPLLDGRRDATATFARQALSDITGIAAGDADPYARWHKLWLEIQGIGRSRDTTRIEVALGIAKGPDPPPLKEVALWALARLGAPWVMPDLIEAMGRAPAPLRASFHRTLAHLAGRNPPFEPAKWEEAVDDWRRWWTQQGPSVQATRSLPLHLDALVSAEREEDAELALAPIVAAGYRAVPEILQRMASPAYSFWLVEALERITDLHLGPAREAWAAWWEREGSRRQFR